MATWYVDSTATGTGAGTSWVNACTTMAAAIALAAAGDDFDVYSGHSESNAAAVNWNFPGTIASPNRIFSCDKTNSPAQASDLVAGALCTITGRNGLNIDGCFYMYGVTMFVGSGQTNSVVFTTGQVASAGPRHMIFDTCQFHFCAGRGCAMQFGTGNVQRNATGIVELINTQFNDDDNQTIICCGDTRLYWRDTPNALPGTAPTTLFGNNGAANFDYAGEVFLKGVDLSAMGSGCTLVASNNVCWYAAFQNCKLGASVTVAATPDYHGNIVDLMNSDSSGTTYRQERYFYEGTLKADTVVVNGASDGTTPISWKITTTSHAGRLAPFETFEIIEWVDTTVSKTATINCVTDLATDATALTNADLWVEMRSMDNSGNPGTTLHSSAPATQLTAGSTLAAGSGWTTTGMTTPDQRQVQITFTNQIKGYVRFVVKVARASLSTLRVDPKIVIA
jgi:hypothetical protein